MRVELATRYTWLSSRLSQAPFLRSNDLNEKLPKLFTRLPSFLVAQLRISLGFGAVVVQTLLHVDRISLRKAHLVRLMPTSGYSVRRARLEHFVNCTVGATLKDTALKKHMLSSSKALW